MTGWILLFAVLGVQVAVLSFFLGVRTERGRAERAAEADAEVYSSKRRDGTTRLSSIRVRR